MNHARRGIVILCLGAGIAAATQIAFAAPRGEGRSVTAVSRYGNGTLTAPVRPAPSGYEVRLPGGVWIHCAGDCADTLRREKLDFWETREEDRGDNDDFEP